MTNNQINNNCLEGSGASLGFTTGSDFQFMRWMVWDEKSESEIQNGKYITIKDPKKANTVFTLTKVPENIKDMELWIKPLCEKRPEVTFVLPQNGEKNIVRNRSIRIVFSKAIDEASFIENIHIYEGVQRVVGGDLIYDKTEISDKVDFELSSTGKTLFIKLNDGELFNPSSYVNVTIDKKMCDVTGASFENDYTLQFQTSNYVDSLAPKINAFKAGLNESLTNLTVLKQDDDDFNDIAKGVALTKNRYAATGANVNAVTINETNTQNYLNFYIDAGDVVGAKTVAGEETQEDDVKSILIRVTKYKTDSGGKMIIDNSFASDTQYIPYRGSDYSDDTMSINGKTAAELLQELGNKSSGCFATYDLNKLAKDGLYRFDIFTEDMDGNNGLDEEYWANHENGYKSVFVAKDTNTLKTGNPEWINSSNTVDSDYLFNRTSESEIDKILRIPYDKTYFGIKSIELAVDKCTSPLSSSSLKVRYGSSKNYSSSLPVLPIESKSGSTITFKEYVASDDITSGYLFIEKLKLGKTHGKVSVSAKLTDNFDAKIQQSEATSVTAYNDQKPPYFRGGSAGSVNDKGLTTINYSYSVGKANENVWPRPGKSGVLSTEFWDSPNIKNKDGVPVRWFYTNAQISSGTYGVGLNFDLVEDKRDITYYYVKHSSGLSTDDQLKTYTASQCIAKGSSTTSLSASWNETFEEGTWSVMLKDAIGNTSPAYTFVVVKDHAKPADTLEDNVDLRKAVMFGHMDSSITKSTKNSDWYRGENDSKANYFRFWNADGHNATFMNTNIFIFTGPSEKIKKITLDISLTGKASGKTYEDKTVSANRYSECKPSRTSSGIAEYSINWAWGDWNTSSKDDFWPAYPKETSNSNVDCKSSCGTSWDGYASWVSYTPGTDISWQIYHQWKSGINYTRFPPVTLFLKDGCGNMTWKKIDMTGLSDRYNWVYEFVHK